MEKLRIGCVVMAAGNASRLGRNKLAAEVDGARWRPYRPAGSAA